MIVHLFNSSSVSGPEALVLPNLAHYSRKSKILLLNETRLQNRGNVVLSYAKRLNLEGHEISVRSRFDREAILALSCTIQELRPKIVHAHDVKASFYLLKAMSILKRKKNSQPLPKIISTHHGVRGRSGIVSRAYERFYSSFVLPYFDRVLCVCNSDREILTKRGLPSNLVMTHLNGVTRPKVDLEFRDETSKKIRHSWHLHHRAYSPSKFTLGMIGRYAAEKRHSLALKVLAQVNQLKPELDWQFVAFGQGPLENRLKELTLNLGLETRVHWMGYRDSVGSELAGLDLILSLSFAEGLPINLIEAGWAGTPIFATWVDGNRDLLPSEDFGVLVAADTPIDSLASQLIEIMTLQKKRREIASCLQKRIEVNFSREVWLERLDSIYSDFI